MTDLDPEKTVFPKVKRLECRSLGAASGQCFPSLRRLKLARQRGAVDAIACLNPAQMTSLELKFTTMDLSFASDLQLLVPAIKRLTRLTRLHLGIDILNPHVDSFPDDDSQSLHSLFDPFVHLRHVSLAAYPDLDVSPAIERLMQQNPLLESLSLDGI